MGWKVFGWLVGWYRCLFETEQVHSKLYRQYDVIVLLPVRGSLLGRLQFCGSVSSTFRHPVRVVLLWHVSRRLSLRRSYSVSTTGLHLKRGERFSESERNALKVSKFRPDDFYYGDTFSLINPWNYLDVLGKCRRGSNRRLTCGSPRSDRFRYVVLR